MAQTPKILFVATVEIHILTFHLPYLKYFNDKGYEVHVACAGKSDIPGCHVKHDIPFERSPFRIGNLKAFFALKALMDKNGYALIHCHTPVGGVIGRLAALGARKRHGTRVLYTAHGFQFYKKGPVKDWLIYYPVEKLMARVTDVLITINQEDYETARRKNFKAGALEKINGIGLDLKRFQTGAHKENVTAVRKSIGIQEKDFVLLCVGELNRNKNQIFLLEVLKRLRADPSLRQPVKLVIAGPDSLDGFLKERAATLGLEKEVLFLGYRKDIPALLDAAEILVSGSLREGLGFNVLEAMAAGKPAVVTDNRGHRELITQGVNGYLIKPGDLVSFSDAVKRLSEDKPLRLALGQAGMIKSRDFGLESVMARMQEIYNRALGMKGP